MDRNTITGLILIAAILIGFSIYTSPSKEELKALDDRRDSLAKLEHERALQQKIIEEQAALYHQQENTDSTFGAFRQDFKTVEEYILENNKVKLNISTKGGRISTVDLKEYRTHDSLPLLLWTENKSNFDLSFYTVNNEQINTSKLFFTPSTSNKSLNASSSEQVLSMRAYVDEDKYLEFIYKLSPDSYMVDFTINAYNLGEVIARSNTFLNLNWDVEMAQFEKSRDFENRYTGVYYNFVNNDVENLSKSGTEQAEITTSIKWLAFKQQFFSSVLIADEAFKGVILSSSMEDMADYLKKASAEIPLPYGGNVNQNYNMQFYFGPNSFTTLKEYGGDINMHKLVDLGWKWIAWFNRYFVIPVFHFLEKSVTQNYGLIIFLLTLLIKLILFPLTYKSYLSQAKMRVLKPQIDEINQKIPADKAMERQQAMMKLYKRAGVNPMGGCLPMLLQMPILIALFYFFPGAIELRQKGFLWATDLASYDSILDLPFKIPFYGSHVSLFCLLMTVTNIVYMKINSKNQPQNDQMKGMQTMMYIMPVMFLFIFNDYSSGLSYYYFIATLITIFQTWIMRKMVNDEKLLKQIEIAKTKPVKKSKFQQRLEDMQKMQEQQMKQKGKKK